MKNKKLKYGLLLIILPLLLLSCLDDGGNEVTLASQPAVIKLHDSKKAILLKGGDLIYSEDLDSNPNLGEGDCGLADFVLDYSLAENINTTESGYFTASKITFNKITKNPLLKVISDTSKVFSGEKTVTSIYEKSVLLENNLFLFTDHSIEIKVTKLDFSYNKEEEPTITEDKKRIYDIYFRIVGDTVSVQKEIKYNVLALDSFIIDKSKIEKEAGIDSLYFRIKYVSAIKNDSTPSWKVSQNFGIALK